jgi:hypothetical protein
MVTNSTLSGNSANIGGGIIMWGGCRGSDDGGVCDDDSEAIKRRISWLSESALVVAWPDHIFRIIEHG